MKYRKLGDTGLEVSEIGFGAWGIGGLTEGATSYGPTSDDDSRLALRAAFDAGITFYDTSDIYGNGHSETLLGESFKHKRHEVVLGSKVGYLRHGGDQDFSSRHIRASLERSLKRLQTDYLDLYQLHSPAIGMLRGDNEVLATMRDLQLEGKIRAFGISTRSPDEGLAAVQEFGFKSIQANLNLLDQRAVSNGLLDFCRKEQSGFVCRTPLCFGFLSGRFDTTVTFDDRDHRSTWHPDQIKLWSGAWRIFWNAALNLTGQTPTQLAIRFCLSLGGISTVIPGMVGVVEVAENIVASDLLPFTPSELQYIHDLYLKNEFFLRDLARI